MDRMKRGVKKAEPGPGLEKGVRKEQLPRSWDAPIHNQHYSMGVGHHHLPDVGVPYCVVAKFHGLRYSLICNHAVNGSNDSISSTVAHQEVAMPQL